MVVPDWSFEYSSERDCSFCWLATVAMTGEMEALRSKARAKASNKWRRFVVEIDIELVFLRRIWCGDSILRGLKIGRQHISFHAYYWYTIEIN